MGSSQERCFAFVALFIFVYGPTGSEATLHLPLYASSNKWYNNVWETVSACAAVNGSLPEVVNTQDLIQLRDELTRMGKDNYLRDFNFYVGLSRWEHFLNGSTDTQQFYVYGTNQTAPRVDNTFWGDAGGTPDNGGGNQPFGFFFGSGGQQKMSDADGRVQNSWAVLVCSLGAPKRGCPYPSKRPTEYFGIRTTAPPGADGYYPFESQADYYCAPGFRFSHLGNNARVLTLQCMGSVGWSERPWSMSCVPDGSNSGIGIRGTVYRFAVMQNTPALTPKNMSFFEAAALCSQTFITTPGLPLLPTNRTGATKNIGNPPHFRTTFGTDFEEVLNFYALHGVPVMLGTTIRHKFDAKASLADQEAYMQKSWAEISALTGIPLLNDPTLAADGLALCAIFTMDSSSGARGIKPVACDKTFSPPVLICQDGTGVCDASVALPPVMTAPDVTTSPLANVSLTFGGTRSYTCPCGSTLENTTYERTRSTTCYGSLGWKPLQELPACVPASLPTLSLGGIMVQPKSTVVDLLEPLIDSARTCANELNATAGPVKLAGVQDWNLLVRYLDAICFAGVLPLAHNTINSLPPGANYTEAVVKSAWSIAFPFNVSWDPSYSTSWPTTGRCTYVQRSSATQPAGANGTSAPPWVVRIYDCSNLYYATHVVCQEDKGTCPSPPGQRRLVTLLEDESARFNATHFKTGAAAMFQCPIGKKWQNATSNSSQLSINPTSFACYGSFGWYPALADMCVGPDICQAGSPTSSYTVFVGNATYDVVAAAEDCFNRFNGSIMEHRDANITADVFKELMTQECLTPQLPKRASLAPTSWEIKDRVRELANTSELATLWRYSDGSSMPASLFTPGEPNSPPPGSQTCLSFPHAEVGGSLARDVTCFNRTFLYICRANSTPAEKSCPLLPRNPPGTQNATVRILNQTATNQPPYPFGTLARFTCPCGFRWLPEETNSWRNPARPRMSNAANTTIDIKCLGTVGWSSYDITNCTLDPTLVTSANLSNGTANLQFAAFTGNHTDGARKCSALNFGLPFISNEADFANLTSLLSRHSCLEGDILLANNILMDLQPFGLNSTQFENAWKSSLNGSVWHSGEPAYNSSDLKLCAAMTLKNGSWKVAAKNCSTVTIANAYLCFNYSQGLGCRADRAWPIHKGNLTGFSRAPNFISSNTANPSETTTQTTAAASILVGHGVNATFRCPCGSLFINGFNQTDFFSQATCWAGLGWMPLDVSACASERRNVSLNGEIFRLDANTSTYGIVEAAKMCFTRVAANPGVIAAPAGNINVIQKIAGLQFMLCVPEVFIAPTSWRSLTSTVNATLSSNMPSTQNWMYENGTALALDAMRFLPGEPDNLSGKEQCLKLWVDPSNPSNYGIRDAGCWVAGDDSSHVCSVSENASNPLTSQFCSYPRNPTSSKPVKAIMMPNSTTAGSALFPFGSSIEFVCPTGYAWSNVTTWGMDPHDNTSITQPLKTNVKVQCLGTLGWTLYDVTECVNLTQCGATPQAGPNELEVSCSLSADSTLTCNRTCQNGYMWASGAKHYNVTCNKTPTAEMFAWTPAVVDSCVERVCNASDVQRFPDVLLDWNGNTTIGVNATYFCPRNHSLYRGSTWLGNATIPITCQENRTWSQAVKTSNETLSCSFYGVCDADRVPAHDGPATNLLLKNSYSTFNGSITREGDKAYLFFENHTETWTCLSSGEWRVSNATIPSCVRHLVEVPESVDQECSYESTTGNLTCIHTCSNDSKVWKSGIEENVISCNASFESSWQLYNDSCVEASCDSSKILDFNGVKREWNGTTSIGSTVSYSCPLPQFGLALGSSPPLKPNESIFMSCQAEGLAWSPMGSGNDTTLKCVPFGHCDVRMVLAEKANRSDHTAFLYPEGPIQIGDNVYYYYQDYSETWTCTSSGDWFSYLSPRWFPERIPVPTLPSYPVDFVETTLYHWGRAVENATCTGCLTGNISAPIESPGPTQFGQGVEIRGWDNECLEDNDFERRANFTCFANPMTCANGSNGISMGFFYKRGIPMKDVYLVYFNPKNSSANYPTKETLVSSGGDREGHPGIHVWWEGPFLGVLVSTGELYWEVLFLPKLFNDTWNNIGFRWFRPTPGVDDDGRLEVLINVEQQAATNQAKRASRVQSMLLPPTMLMGCHKDSTNTQKRFYGEGFFDEVAFWDTFIFDNTSRMFAGGYLPELNGVPTSVILDSIRESAKLEDERTRQVAWIAVQSIASDTNMTSEPVRPADAALNKTGETPSQQVENLVKFVTTLQSAEYISSSNSIGAVAKAARTSMSATSTLLSGNRHAWEEIADAGYKPGAYALVKSQNDYFMNMADSIAVDTKMTSAQMIDVTSDEIVSKLGVARIGHLRQSPTLKFPNYEDEIWGNGSMSKKFDYPVDTIEVPLGLYFPSSKTCDGTNLVNIEMNAYKNLDDFMPPNKVNPLKIVSQDNVIDSNILYFAFTLNKNIPKAKVAGCQPDALAMISNPIKLLFRHKMDEPAQEAGFKSRKLKFHTEEVEYNIKVRRCVWWNPSMNEFGGWDPSGCNIYDTADNFTMCECAAQGLFGILGEMIQHYELPTEPTWLTVVKFVGYGLSILCLPLFIVIVLKSKDHLHDQFHIMRANLAFALLVGLILHCISDLHSIRDSRHACTAISVMFHYFYTAAGAWFCFESYASFVAITQGIIGGKLRAYIPLCWGLPFLSVGAALIQDMLSYGTDPRCMISFDNEMKWIFFGPLLTFASIGFLLSAIVICNISTPALRKDHIADELVSVGQGLAAQVTYFLCTWIAGVCAYFIYDWTIETPGFYALFQVLNAYTGVFYLVFMGFISLRFRMVVLGVAQKRKLMILQYLTRNQHEQLKPTPSVDNQQSDELPDELFAEGGPSSGRRKILTST